MNSVIVATSEERDINYKNILGFFSYKMCGIDETHKTEEGQCLLVDIRDKGTAIDLVNRYRKLNDVLPVLLLTDYSDTFFPEDLHGIRGSGQVRIHSSTPDNGERIVEMINSVLNPEYASETFKLSVIIPLYNEGDRFGHVLNFAAKMNRFLEKSYRNSKIYFIDDGSIDDTRELTTSLMEHLQSQSDYISDFGFITQKNLRENTRKAGTYIEGIRSVDGNVIIIVDGDDSFHIEDISRMINILREGYYDVIAATKDFSDRNRPLTRKVLSWFKRILTKPFLPRGVYDCQTGLKGFRREAARHILPHMKVEREFAIDLEMIYLCKLLKFRVLQLPVAFIEREGSHVDVVKDSIQFLKNLVDIARNTKLG